MASDDTQHQAKTAELYRMVPDEHVCPFGLKTRDLLDMHKRKGSGNHNQK